MPPQASPAAPPAPASRPAASPDDHPWKVPARRVAWVAGVYCAVVAVILIFSYFKSRSRDPINHRPLAELKASLVDKPLDEELKQRIRTLDLQLRADYFRYLGRVQQSGWLLFGGVLTLLPALYYATWRKRLPRPGKYVSNPGLYARDARNSRLAVGALAALAAGAGLWTVSQSQSDLALATAKKAPAGTNAVGTATANADASFPTFEEIARQWPRFRGPSGNGISPYANLPEKVDAASGTGVRWKTPLPYASPSSPVRWSDRLFLTGGNSGQREIACVDANSGKILWQKPVGKPGKQLSKEDEEGRYYAVCTPATDGRRVYAIFETGDLAAFDYDGNQVWAKSLGKPDNQYGYATSLEIYQNTLIIQWDEGDEESGKSKIIALNTATGAEAWKTEPRPVGATWSTPAVFKTPARFELIAAGNPWLMSYDPATGKELWRAKVCHGEVTPSPVFGGGLIITANEEIFAIKPDGAGDVTKTQVAWKGQDGIPDICSPLCDGKYAYVLTSSGILTVYDLANPKPEAKPVYEKELEEDFKASPSAAGDRLYLFSEKGNFIVAQAGAEYKEIAKSSLGDEILACPAFADGLIFVRGKTNLFCLGGSGAK